MKILVLCHFYQWDICTMKNEFNSIQALRGIAALMVVVYHATISAGLTADLGDGDRSFLDAGVDIFFVISGFVMIIATSGRSMTPWAFLKARLTRIVPLYWIALLVTLIVGVAFSKFAFPKATDILMAYLFLPYVNPNGQIAPFLTAGWTLSYEMFFYLVFALLIAIPAWRRSFIILALFIALVGIRPVVGDFGPIAFRLTSPLLLEFVAGMFLALTIEWTQKVPAFAGILLVAFGAVLGIFAASEMESLPRFIAQGGPAILIVAGVLRLEPFISSTARPIRYLGDASYSVYLFHSLFILAPAALGAAEINGHIWAVLMTFSGVLGGLLAFKAVEEPLIKFFKRRRFRNLDLQRAADPAG